MSLANGFDDPAEETEYVHNERDLRRPTTRALLVIAMLSFLGFFFATPISSSNESLMVFNLTSLAIAASFSFAYYLIGTRFYIEWRWLDTSVFVVATVAAVFVLRTLLLAEAVDEPTLLIIATMVFAGNIFIASVAFVANLKYFTICLAAQSAIYLLFVDRVDSPTPIKLYAIIFVLIFEVSAFFCNWEFDRRSRAIFTGRKLLEAERKKTESLLYNVLPQAVAKRLRGGEVVADSFSDLTVIFVDIVGFSKLAKELTPGHLIQHLNRFFLIADQCAERLGIEKVKTIGDAYLAVAGGTASASQGAKDAVQFGVELISRMMEVARETQIDIKLRVGIHSGPVVGGVIGSSRLAYDYWGDTMNIASRIEGAASPNGMAVSTTTYNQCVDRYEFDPPETINLKGVGETRIHRLKLASDRDGMTDR